MGDRAQNDTKPPTAGAANAVLEPGTGRAWLLIDEDALLGQCVVDAYRASGPGGQKRNKTSSAVRLRHGPTGLIVVGTESRSQHENKARALRRLREAIALTQRSEVPPADPVPRCVTEAIDGQGRLRANPKNPNYLVIVQYLLDVLVAESGAVGDAGKRVGLSTGQLIRFFGRDSKLWEQVNRIRERFGLKRLTS